jgi:glycosyltransferase involved in cell wall biosynthesis
MQTDLRIKRYCWRREYIKAYKGKKMREEIMIEKPKGNSHSITLCICTMNRAEDLSRCLDSVFQGNEMPDEIIVSDDSLDCRPTQLVVAKYPCIIYQEGPHRGLGPNRNACIKCAKSSHIIFIDDDVRVPSEFFGTAQRLIASADSKTIITGHEMNYGGGGRWEGEVLKVIPHNPDFWGYQKVSVGIDYVAIVINSTIFPTSLFEQALFDENLRYGFDDLDMAQHAVALGYCIVYEDCLYVNHYPSPVNREQYDQFIHASRLYVMTKGYWQYERSPLKTLAYILLAPLHIVGSAVRRGDVQCVWKAIQSTVLAGRYLFTRLS